MNPQSIIQVATDLQANSNKTEIVQMARALGWKGDHARAPMLQLALYVATKLAAGESAEQHTANATHSSPSADSQQQGQQGQPEQEAPQGQQGQPEQEAPQGQQEEQEEQEAQSNQSAGADQGQAPQGQQDQQEAQSNQSAGADQGQAPQGQQEEQEEQEEQEPPAPDEFQTLLASSGINRPHALLHKVWLLTAKAKQNVLLIGPAGSGKTMLAQQLGQLLRVPFGSISCTMGMSESQLTGWLLPVGENGRFDYVPAPFVSCLQQPSVFLLDELDAADPNVLMLGNSVWSNGFITIPHKLGSPMVQRHNEAIVIAGANTVGTGADDLYSARATLDGSTIDRFYPVVVDYDESYEHGLFAVGRKSRKASPAWMPAAVPDQAGFDDLRKWFFALRTKTKSAKLSKIISSRLAQRLVASVKVGIPAEEAKRDLLVGWSDDERARVGA